MDLTPEDLERKKGEMKAPLDHHLDEREYVDIGLDSGEITCSL